MPERCAQVGSLQASYAIEVVGTQEYRFGDTFLTRFEEAYGTDAASEIAPHVRFIFGCNPFRFGARPSTTGLGRRAHS